MTATLLLPTILGKEARTRTPMGCPLRQYFPKSMELDNVSEQEVIIAVDKLNSRPRKCLDYMTPYEAFKESTGMDARKVMGYALMT